jgi:hypothetical protein
VDDIELPIAAWAEMAAQIAAGLACRTDGGVPTYPLDDAEDRRELAKDAIRLAGDILADILAAYSRGMTAREREAASQASQAEAPGKTSAGG